MLLLLAKFQIAPHSLMDWKQFDVFSLDAFEASIFFHWQSNSPYMVGQLSQEILLASQALRDWLHAGRLPCTPSLFLLPPTHIRRTTNQFNFGAISLLWSGWSSGREVTLHHASIKKSMKASDLCYWTSCSCRHFPRTGNQSRRG